MKTPLYKKLASTLLAMHNCENTGNHDWYRQHKQILEKLVKDHMPSGSGFNTGTQLCFENSDSEKLVFLTQFHHMNEHGFYDGWSNHTVTVRASLVHDFTLKIDGNNRNDIKEVIHDAFSYALDIKVE